MNTVVTEGPGAATVVKRPVGFLLGIGILLIPLIFAWVTLRRGYSVLARVVSFVWLLVVVVILIAAGSSPKVVTPATAPVTDASLPSPSGSSSTDAAGTSGATTASSAPKLDAAAYARIKTGMSYAAVRDIVGADGEEQSSSDLGGIKTAAYTWKNNDGSNMILIFQNGRLASKAQFGLR